MRSQAKALRFSGAVRGSVYPPQLPRNLRRHGRPSSDCSGPYEGTSIRDVTAAGFLHTGRGANLKEQGFSTE